MKLYIRSPKSSEICSIFFPVPPEFDDDSLVDISSEFDSLSIRDSRKHNSPWLTLLSAHCTCRHTNSLENVSTLLEVSAPMFLKQSSPLPPAMIGKLINTDKIPTDGI